MARQKTAFTFVEVVLVVIFLGIIALIAIPRLSFSAISGQKADSLTRKIITDLRRTRRLAISNAAGNNFGFKLSMEGPSPYTGYIIVDVNSGDTVDSHSIDSAVSCTGDSEFEFGPLGNLLSGSGTQLTISAGEKEFTIDITSATGMVKCTEN
jgi:type II secretory pathway pseudopilin PulG